MTIQLDETISAAWLARHSWGRHQLHQILDCVRVTLPSGKTDWDEEAGENWARVLVNAEVACLLSVNCPLVIVLDRYLPAIAGCVSNAVVVSVDSMETRAYAASRESARRLRGAEPDEIDFAGFSMEELWWATV